MRRSTLIFVPFLLSAGMASAFEVTIKRASPVRAAPTSAVSKGELAPPPGVAVAPERAAPAYAPEYRQRAAAAPTEVPIPVSNPVAVSFCLSDVL